MADAPNPIDPESLRSDPIHPDLLAWARQTFDLEAYRDAVLEMNETGGVQFNDFIDEVEKRVKGHE